MPAIDLGTRRHCQACGASYYDFARTPIKCPIAECGAVFDPEILLKSRRVRPVPAAPAEKKAEVIADTDEAAPEIDTDIENVDEAGAEDNGEVMDDDSDIIKVKKDDDDDEEVAAVVTGLDAVVATETSDDDGDGDDDADSDAEDGDDDGDTGDGEAAQG